MAPCNSPDRACLDRRRIATPRLRAAVASGVNHIDTSDFYGPHITNQLIREALHPYPDDLVIVTKVGPSRPGEFHPEPLTDPDLNLSIHPARVTARRLPPSAEPSGSSPFDPRGPRSTTMTHPPRSI